MRSVRLRISGWLALVVLTASSASAQSAASGRPARPTATAPVVTVTGAGAGILISIAPTTAARRTVLAEIVRLTGTTIRNLDSVPDEQIFVEFSRTPLASALNSILQSADVGFALRPGSDHRPPTAIVFGPASARSSEPAVSAVRPPEAGYTDPARAEVLAPAHNAPFDVPVAEPAELPAVTRGPSRDSPARVQLDARPVVLEIHQLPMWRPLVSGTPVEMPIAAVPPSPSSVPRRRQ